jgi:hypothetical protein
MAKKAPLVTIPDAVIINKIIVIRDKKVMLDKDLAELYGVPTKRLNEQVRRNMKRFPLDFMFQLTEKEVKNLRSQIATSSWGGARTLPYVFTEHGAVMLASILNSDKAIRMNIHIVRVFTQIRQVLLDSNEFRLEIEKMKKQLEKHGENFQNVFRYLDELTEQKNKPRRQIGYKITKKK